MLSGFLKTGLISATFIKFGKLFYCFITEMGMSFKIDGLFEGNFVMALIIPFLEFRLKAKLPFPTYSFINPQLSSILNDWIFLVVEA